MQQLQAQLAKQQELLLKEKESHHRTLQVEKQHCLQQIQVVVEVQAFSL